MTIKFYESKILNDVSDALKDSYELGRSEAKARIEELEDCLRFYADASNWESHEHAYPATTVIIETDEEFLTTVGRHCGGKRARTALAKRGKGE